MLCPKPGCATSVGSEQQEELVHAVGMAVSFGSEGRSREMMGRDHSQQRKAQLWAVDLSSQGETQGTVRCSQDSAPSWTVPISQFTSEFKLLPAPEDNSLQKDRDLLSEICR